MHYLFLIAKDEMKLFKYLRQRFKDKKLYLRRSSDPNLYQVYAKETDVYDKFYMMGYYTALRTNFLYIHYLEEEKCH